MKSRVRECLAALFREFPTAFDYSLAKVSDDGAFVLVRWTAGEDATDLAITINPGTGEAWTVAPVQVPENDPDLSIPRVHDTVEEAAVAIVFLLNDLLTLEENREKFRKTMTVTFDRGSDQYGVVPKGRLEKLRRNEPGVGVIDLEPVSEYVAEPEAEAEGQAPGRTEQDDED